jgi:spermidine/putrescine transport system substrate-binding protein
MKRSPMRMLLAAAFAALAATAASAQDNKLRLLTWADYVPADVVAQFKKETGIDVEVTLSNNEEMISAPRDQRRRIRPGAAVAGPHRRSAAEIRDLQADGMTKIKTELFIPSMLEATKKNTTLKGQVYGRRTSGEPMASSSIPSSRRCPTIPTCTSRSTRARPACASSPTLLAFAFASGKDPFALYNDPKPTRH